MNRKTFFFFSISLPMHDSLSYTCALKTFYQIFIKQQTEYSSRIQFRPTPNDDGRYLRCRAWNPDINTTKDNIKNKALLLYVQCK